MQMEDKKCVWLCLSYLNYVLALLRHSKIFGANLPKLHYQFMVSHAHTAEFALFFLMTKASLIFPRDLTFRTKARFRTNAWHNLFITSVEVSSCYFVPQLQSRVKVWSATCCFCLRSFSLLSIPSLPFPSAVEFFACLSAFPSRGVFISAAALPPTSSPLPLPLLVSVAEHDRASAKMKESFMSEIEKVWADHKKELEESLKVSCCSCTAALVWNFQLSLQLIRAGDKNCWIHNELGHAGFLI